MKPSKDNDKAVIAELKRQAKADLAYQKPMLEARKIKAKREAERLTGYDKFKRQQKKSRDAEEMLTSYLTKKS
jgi:hypothetical protein